MTAEMSVALNPTQAPEETLMNRLTSIILGLSISTAAVAGDRDLIDTTGDRETAGSTTTMDIWPPPTFPFPKPIGGPYDPIGDLEDLFSGQEVQIELVGSGEGFRGSQEYDFDVDGEIYTVSVFTNNHISTLSLLDDDAELVVGYTTSARGSIIFDDDGVVERGSAEDIDMSVIQDYGLTATLLTNANFLDSFLGANGETFGGDDDPPAAWWVVGLFVLRCIDLSVTVESSGDWSATVGIDC